MSHGLRFVDLNLSIAEAVDVFWALLHLLLSQSKGLYIDWLLQITGDLLSEGPL